MATRTISNAGGNWNAVGAWVEGAVPTSADDVVATATSGNLTVNVDANCRSIDLTGYVGTLTHNNGINLNVGDGSGGKLKFVAGMTYTKANNTVPLNFVSITTGNQITTGGKSLGAVTFNGAGGGWTFQDAFTCTGTLTLTAGTLNDGSQAVSCLVLAASGSTVRALTLGSGTWSLTRTTAGTVINLGGSNFTLTKGTATFAVSVASANTRDVFLAGQNIYALTYTVATSTGILTIDSSSSTGVIDTLNVSGGARTVQFTSSKTVTVGTFNVFGTAGNLVSITSSVSGTAATLSCAANISQEYLSIKDSTVSGGGQYFAGANSTNVSGNTGWTFTAPGWTKSVADTATPTETQAKDMAQAQDEAPALADSMGKGVGQAQSEAAGLADATAKAATVLRTEAVAVADSLGEDEATFTTPSPGMVRIVTSLPDGAIAESHRVATLIEVLSNGEVIDELSTVMDGTVTLDATAASRGRFDLTVIGENLVPTGPDSLLAPYDNEIRISRGIVFPDRTELVRLGVFGIDQSASDDGLQTRVSGLDRSGRFVDASFEEGGTIASGTSAQIAIVSVLQAVWPALTYDFAAPDVPLPLLTFSEGENRWTFCLGIADSMGCELYFNDVGVLVLRPVPSASFTAPAAEITRGDVGTLLEITRNWDRSAVYNRVIVTGENTSNDDSLPPPRGIATDDNPFSPTYYYGSFGRKPYFWSNSFISSDTQAQDAASGILARTIGAPDSLSFGAVVDPTLRPSDVVRVIYPQLSIAEAHILDSVTLPLSSDGTMAATTRAAQVLL